MYTNIYSRKYCRKYFTSIQTLCDPTHPRNNREFMLNRLSVPRENSFKGNQSVFTDFQHRVLDSSEFWTREIRTNCFTYNSKTITFQARIFLGMFSTMAIYIPCRLCVNLKSIIFLLSHLF